MNTVDDSQYYLNCTNLTISQLNHINLSRGLTAALCVILLIPMLIFLCWNRAYHTVTQRLFLYLAIFSELCLTATLEHQFHYSHQANVCIALGFVTHWASTIVASCILSFILYTIIFVYLTIKFTRLLSIQVSKGKRILMECLIFSPLTYIWVPLLHGNYVLAVGYCWIRASNQNCEEVGLKDQLIVGYVFYEFVGIVAIVAMAGITVTYCRLSSNLTKIKKLHIILTFLCWFS